MADFLMILLWALHDYFASSFVLFITCTNKIRNINEIEEILEISEIAYNDKRYSDKPEKMDKTDILAIWQF